MKDRDILDALRQAYNGSFSSGFSTTHYFKFDFRSPEAKLIEQWLRETKEYDGK